jgi:hypothetical protein
MQLFSFGPLPSKADLAYLAKLKGLAGISVTTTAGAMQKSYKGPISFQIYDQASAAAKSISKQLYFRAHFGDGCPKDLPGQVTLPGSCYSSGPTQPKSVTLPFPTDPVYQTYVDGFIAALGAHCNGDPTLAYQSACGPSRQGEDVEPTCPEWLALCTKNGLTAPRLLSIWEHDFALYRKYFPAHITTFGMENPMGILAGQLAYLKTLGVANFLCQQNGLRSTSAIGPKSPWGQAKALGFAIGAQTWGDVAQGNGPLATTLSIAKAGGLKLVEVYAQDVLNPANAAMIGQYGS